MDPDMAALFEQSDDGPRVPASPQRRRGVESSDLGSDAPRGDGLSAPNPYAHRAPPERPALKPRPQPRVGLALGGAWQLYGRIGNEPQAIAGANLFGAYHAYGTARRALQSCGDAGQKPALKQAYDGAGDALCTRLARVCAEVPDEEVDAFLETHCPAHTVESAEDWVDKWRQWRRKQRAAGVARPAAPPVSTPPRTAAAPAPIPARPVMPEVRQPPPAAPVKRAAAAPAAPATAEDDLIWELHSEGLSVRAIERETGIPKSTVSRSINARRSMHP